MYILDEPVDGRYKRLVFLAQPRTASTSIAHALMKVGAVRVGGHHEYGDVVLQSSHFVFSGIRRHVDMFASFYGREKQPDETPEQYWERFIDSNVWVRSKRLFWRYRWCSDILCRYEELGMFWRYLDGMLPTVTLPALPRLQSTGGVLIADDLRDTINEYFSTERTELDL